MIFVIHGLDKPLSSLRDQLAQAHHAYLERCSGAQDAVEILHAGPLLDDAGKRMIGTMIIVECGGRRDVDHFLAGEPFNRGGLFESLQVIRWHKQVKNLRHL